MESHKYLIKNFGSANNAVIQIVGIYHRPNDNREVVNVDMPNGLCTGKTYTYAIQFYFETNDSELTTFEFVQKCGCPDMEATVISAKNMVSGFRHLFKDISPHCEITEI
jgi:hypothetical protein